MKQIIRLFAVSAVILAGNAASPPVTVSLRSSWPAPPLLTEILETISLENPDAFFPLLDRFTDPTILAPPQTMTSEAIHEATLEIAARGGFLVDAGSMAAVKMNLALHAATPKIEAFYNHYSGQANSIGAICGSWVDWYGEIVCDVETLARLAGKETIDAASGSSQDFISYTRPKILSFDHIYPVPGRTLESPPRTAVFYASMFSSNFRELHTYLLSLAQKPSPYIEYVFRHIPSSGTSDNAARNYLSGYGVALDLKKTDYLAVDDRHSHNQDSGPSTDDSELELDVDHVLTLIEAYPENTNAPDVNTPLTAEELQRLGHRAVQLIADSPDPMNTLTTLSQNFPKYASSLARRVVVNDSLSTEIHDKSLKVQGGYNAFWLNGATIAEKDLTPLALLRLLKKEKSMMQSLISLGLSRSDAVELITHPSVGAAQSDKGVLDGLFDASDRPEEGGVITWWNDLEHDSRYASWSPSLHGLLRPMYPGQFPSVKLNLFNTVTVMDLSQTKSLIFLAAPVSNIIERTYPFRFGVVPMTETEESMRMARLFYHLLSNYGRRKTMVFIKKIAQIQVPPHLQTPTVDWDLVRSVFEDLVENEGQGEATEEATEPITLDDILDGKSTATPPYEKIQHYTERLGATLAATPLGHAFVNGKHFDMDENFLRAMQVEIAQQLQFLQEQLYSGKISEESQQSMGTFFYDQPTTSQRRNKYIYPATAAGSLRIFNLLDLVDQTGFHPTFVYPPGSDAVPLSLYVVADFDSDAGRTLMKETLVSLDVDSRSRATFIHNPPLDRDPRVKRDSISWLLSHLLSKDRMSNVAPQRLSQALGFDITPLADGLQAPMSRDEAVMEVTQGVPLSKISTDGYDDYLRTSRLLTRKLQIAPGESTLVVNGRIVGPLQSNDFVAADFKALENYEFHKRAESVAKALESVISTASSSDKIAYSNLISMSSSVISAMQLPDPSEFSLLDAPPRPRQRNYRLLESEYTSFGFGDNTTALFHVAALIDPLSETAQKWSSLIEWLSNIPDIHIEIHMNPAPYTEMPLKRFYRYNLAPSLSFDKTGFEINAQAVFEDLPVDPIYTLAMDVPPSWLVRPREALYDLDNIQLGSLLKGDVSVEAVFDLDYLVVEGHARDTNTNAPPRGVQVQLSDTNGAPVDDTQVVANLGYLQFKAKPGVFRLEIREGRGREIFEMESVGNDGWDSPTVEDVGSEITLTSFEGLTLYPRLSRVKGMESEDVLEEPEDSSVEPVGIIEDIASRIMSIFRPKDDVKALVPSNDQAEINIFTVASGLLYERFVSIMILSVLRNTNSTVKFWFIENFLSPSFLEFIPHMAEAYGFKYELITYKWPSWLRAQKEKQRIIWAYKILFLDVLFPMDLKKVIFVDADQIVRADLKELVDLDLHGAPYGYTPMGDDNTDMEGFRFWKTGYWKDFLQGKPYHISALYVIDLVRFRHLAAGDILRGQYQQLSADPASLANLDQDLPNNLQQIIPIYSLHEDWLWCETWCSKDRLHRAKTIDLCQNPLTKEPKLARARQIPEWDEYDKEISRFASKLAEDGVIRSRIAAADANVLANAGAAVTPDSARSSTKATREVVETEVHERDEL